MKVKTFAATIVLFAFFQAVQPNIAEDLGDVDAVAAELEPSLTRAVRIDDPPARAASGIQGLVFEDRHRLGCVRRYSMSICVTRRTS